MPAPSRTFTLRHVQLSRAVLAAVAALMITFSPDHSAAVGLSVFSGFAISTSLVMILAAVIVHPAGQRWPAITSGALSFVAGMVASVPAIRSVGLFFGVVIAWAALTGLVELIAGLRRRGSEDARDAIVTGSLGLLLAVVMLLVPIGFAQDYSPQPGVVFTVTGIVLAVGFFGGYAAIVAVFQGIAGLTPSARKAAQTDAGIDRLADHGGHA